MSTAASGKKAAESNLPEEPRLLLAGPGLIDFLTKNLLKKPLCLLVSFSLANSLAFFLSSLSFFSAALAAFSAAARSLATFLASFSASLSAFALISSSVNTFSTFSTGAFFFLGTTSAAATGIDLAVEAEAVAGVEGGAIVLGLEVEVEVEGVPFEVVAGVEPEPEAIPSPPPPLATPVPFPLICPLLLAGVEEGAGASEERSPPVNFHPPPPFFRFLHSRSFCSIDGNAKKSPSDADLACQ